MRAGGADRQGGPPDLPYWVKADRFGLCNACLSGDHEACGCWDQHEMHCYCVACEVQAQYVIRAGTDFLQFGRLMRDE